MSSEKHDFVNGDGVIATEGGFQVVGVVSEIYDDVVEIDYFDSELGIDGHDGISCVLR